jgi:hypothetical protein
MITAKKPNLPQVPIQKVQLTNLSVPEIKRRDNILFSRHHNTLSPGLLSVEHCVLHFPYILLVPVIHDYY